MKKATLYYLYLFTALTTVLYWILVSAGIFGPANLAAWLTRFPYVSPIADCWMAGTALMAFFCWRQSQPQARLWALSSSSAMIFVALTAFTYRLGQGQLSVDLPGLIEWIAPAFLLLFGALSWRVLYIGKD